MNSSFITPLLLFSGLAYLFYSEKNDKKKLCYHFAEWCAHCQQFKPTWSKIKKYCSKNNIEFVEINHTDKDNIVVYPECNLKSTNKINGFPTILFESIDGKIVEYQGNRDYDNLLYFIKNN